MSWQWWNTLETEAVEDGQSVLRVNVDETNVSLRSLPGAGIILGERVRGDPVLVSDSASGKGSLTHVAFICDNPEMQKHMPQMIIGNHHVLLKRDLAAMDPWLPKNVFLIREKSSWVTAALFAACLEFLAIAVNRAPRRFTVLLLMDCCNVHLHATVLRKAKRCGFRVCFVPRNMTWLMQPCDTHLFRAYKACVRRSLYSTQSQQGSLCVKIPDVVRAMVEATHEVMECKSWSRSFGSDGYTPGQTMVSPRVWRSLGGAPPHGETPHIGMTVDALASILPRRRHLPTDLLMPRPRISAAESIMWPKARRLPLPRAAGRRPADRLTSSAARAAAVGMLHEPYEVAIPWASRLRPRDGSAAGSVSTVASDTGLPPAPRRHCIRPCPSSTPSSTIPATAHPAWLLPARAMSRAKAEPRA